MPEYDLIILSDIFLGQVRGIPSPGFGDYKVGRVTLRDGRVFTAQFANCIYLISVKGHDAIPFSLDEILRIDSCNEEIDNDLLKRRLSVVVRRGLIEFDSIIRPAPGSITSMKEH